MTFIEENRLDEIRNEIELFAYEELERQLNRLPDSKVCKCIDCIQDMACFALNQIKPRYTVSLLGSLFTKVETRARLKEIEEVVGLAVRKISRNPFHENPRE